MAVHPVPSLLQARPPPVPALGRVQGADTSGFPPSRTHSDLVPISNAALGEERSQRTNQALWVGAQGSEDALSQGCSPRALSPDPHAPLPSRQPYPHSFSQTGKLKLQGLQRSHVCSTLTPMFVFLPRDVGQRLVRRKMILAIGFKARGGGGGLFAHWLGLLVCLPRQTVS